MPNGSKLPINWQKVKVEDIKKTEKGSIVSGPFGSNIGKRFFVETGIPLIRGNNLSLGKQKFIDDGFVFITKEKAYELRNCEAVKNDLIFTAAGTLGQIGIIPKNSKFQKYIISNKQLRIRCNLDIIDPLYAYYWFSSPMIRIYIQNQNTGSSVPLITLGTLRNLPINLPPLLTQQKIVAILSAYDNLIENNAQRIKILEEMVQSIYREWFVNFRFSGHESVRMVESELGPVPERWELRNLGEVCNITMGQSPKSEYYNEVGEGLPFHQGVTNFGPRFPVDKFFCTITNRIAEPGDIIFSVRAPVGRINLADKKIVIGRGLSAIRHKNGKQLFTYHQLKEIFQEEDTIGGGTIFKSVTKEDVNKIKVLTPVSSFINLFEENVEPISLQLDNLIKRNVNLRRTRDLLLPKLISGELDVSGLDIRIPEAEA